MSNSSYTKDDIRPSDIADEYSNLIPDKVLFELDVKPGTLISLQNVNNLSEVLIYRRTNYTYNDNRILRWDGETTDIRWYNENLSTFIISNAEQLAGLALLVNNGYDFKGKTIRLNENINLNGHEWTPIGSGVDMSHHTTTGHPRLTANAVEHPFCGVFDGDHHTIYGLKISNVIDGVYCMGFFGACLNATIQNINFSNVLIGNTLTVGSYTGVIGYAEDTTCTNIIVSGYICGTRVSGICGVGVDSTFHGCINRTMLACTSPIENHTLAVGGIVQQISLSEDSMKQIPEDSYALIFNRCIQDGRINIDAKDAKYLWSGQIYATLESNIRKTNITLDRCRIGLPVKFQNLNLMRTKANVVGIEEGLDGQIKSIFPSDNHKHDLLNGLLGKTDTDVGIKTYNVTNSVRINSIPIPGSVNLMQSKPNDKFFTTVDVLPINDGDGIINLLPYYEYVKTATI